MQGEDDPTVVSGLMKTPSISSVSPISLLTTREGYVRGLWACPLGNAEP